MNFLSTGDFSREQLSAFIDKAIAAKRVLGRQGRGGRHGVAVMSGNDLLVGLEAPIRSDGQWLRPGPSHGWTNAPPELSEPAMTSTLPRTMARLQL